MKVVLFGEHGRVGLLQGEMVVDANAAVAAFLAEKRNVKDAQHQADLLAPAELNAFIAGGTRALDQVKEATAYLLAEAKTTGLAGQPVFHPMRSVKLPAPWQPGNRIACAGANYPRHLAGIRAANEGRLMDVTEIRRQSREAGPWGFWKVPDRVLSDGDAVRYPARATLFDYEGEVAVVIGRDARDVSADRARDYIWGITLVNDWSIRNDMGQGRPMSFNLPKVFDDSTSMGPCIRVDDFDPQNIAIQTRVNGGIRQDYNADQMTWSFAEFLELLSRDFTFHPGDVISGGTGAGTAMDSSRPGPDGKRNTELYLKPGDVVEVASPSIGRLRNKVIAKH